MFRAFPRTALHGSRCFASFLALVAMLVFGARIASAQTDQAQQTGPTPPTGYAQIWSPGTARESGSLHLHGGMFSPIDVNAPSPTVGLRLSKVVSAHMQMGLLTGWTFERKDRTRKDSPLPGTAPEILLARLDGHIIPAMGFMRVNLTEKHWLLPYFGFGVGYEWLLLDATNYETQETAQRTYSGIAWEGWGGLGIRLGRDLRVNGELFYNSASVERDVVDDAGQTWKELVNLDGAGARVGIDIMFH